MLEEELYATFCDQNALATIFGVQLNSHDSGPY